MSFRYLFVFESGVDEEEESVLHTFSLTDVRLWETGANAVSSRTWGRLGISKDTAEKNKEERITF